MDKNFRINSALRFSKEIFFALAFYSMSMVLSGCSKSKDVAFVHNEVENIQLIEHVQFAEILPLVEDEGRFDEISCLTPDSLPSIRCFRSVGHSCRKETDCTSVLANAVSGNFTEQEIQSQIEIVERDFGIKYVY